MKTFAFVRSRTYYREFDYRLLTPISSLPKDVHTHFSKSVSNLMRDSASDWESPTWLLIKHADYLLWGFAVSNSVFSPEFDKEEIGRTGLRCFCGVVITDYSPYELRLPFDINAFRSVFNHTVGALWEKRIYELPNTKVELDEADNYIEPTGYGANLNINANVCRLFASDTDSHALLSAALSCKYDISVAVNVMDSSQVYDSKAAYPILNAIMRNSSTTTDIMVSRNCSKCGKVSNDIVDGMCHDCRSHNDVQEEPVINVHKRMPETYDDVPVQCPKCGTIYLSKDFCPTCAKRRKMEKYFIWSCIVLFSLIAWGARRCSPLHNFHLRFHSTETKEDNSSVSVNDDTPTSIEQDFEFINNQKDLKQ